MANREFTLSAGSGDASERLIPREGDLASDAVRPAVDLSDSGALWEDALVTDALRVLSFAGQSVPDDGVTVYPPQGGELTVWPDGGYAFTPPDEADLSDSQEAVSTYYSYVMEDSDGETSLGTFALNFEAPVPESMHDFQAWSLPELLHVDSPAEIFLAGIESGALEIFASPPVDSSSFVASLGFVGSDSALEDDLTQLIINSQSS